MGTKCISLLADIFLNRDEADLRALKGSEKHISQRFKVERKAMIRNLYT